MSDKVKVKATTPCDFGKTIEDIDVTVTMRPAGRTQSGLQMQFAIDVVDENGREITTDIMTMERFMESIREDPFVVGYMDIYIADDEAAALASFAWDHQYGGINE